MKQLLFLILATLVSVISFAAECPYCNQQIDEEDIAHVQYCSLQDENSETTSESETDDVFCSTNKRPYDSLSNSYDLSELSRSEKKQKTCNLLIESAKELNYNGVICALNKGENIDAIGKDGSALRCVFQYLTDNFDGNDMYVIINTLKYLLKSNANVMDAVLNGNAFGILIESTSYHKHCETGYDRDPVPGKILSICALT